MHVTYISLERYLSYFSISQLNYYTPPASYMPKITVLAFSNFHAQPLQPKPTVESSDLFGLVLDRAQAQGFTDKRGFFRETWYFPSKPFANIRELSLITAA